MLVAGRTVRGIATTVAFAIAAGSKLIEVVYFLKLCHWCEWGARDHATDFD